MRPHIVSRLCHEILAKESEYRYDPTHQNKPQKGTWTQTEQGWTSAPDTSSDKPKQQTSKPAEKKEQSKDKPKDNAEKAKNDYSKVDAVTLRNNVKNNLESVADQSKVVTTNVSRLPVTKENVKRFQDTARTNAQSVLARYSKVLRPDTKKMLDSHIDKFLDSVAEGVADGSLSDVAEADLDALLRDDMVVSLHQQVETESRSLGDHGIRHNISNAANAVSMLEQVQKSGQKITGRQKVMAMTVMANHDLGYTVGETATDITKGGGHKANSGTLAKQERSKYSTVFGEKGADEVIDLIEHHDEPVYDWKAKPLASAIHLSDVTALFGKAKVQDLFIRSEKAMSIACEMRMAAEAGDEDMLKEGRESLHKLIDKDFDGDKHLHRQVDEMTEGKFSTTVDILSRFSGRLDGYRYDGASGVMNVDMSYSPEGETLDMLFGDEVSANQFNKFVKNDLKAETVKGKSGSTVHKDASGKPQVQLNIKGVSDSPIDQATSDSMKDFLKNTVRNQMRQARSLLTRPPEDVVRNLASARKVFEPVRDVFDADEWQRLMDFFEEFDKSHKGDEDVGKLKKNLSSFPLLKSEKAWLRQKTRVARVMRLAARICMDF